MRHYQKLFYGVFVLVGSLQAAFAEEVILRRPLAPGAVVVPDAGVPGAGVRPGAGIRAPGPGVRPGIGANGVGARPGVGAGAPGAGLTVRGPAGVGRR